MKINIFGSTGVIGSKSLILIKKHFPFIKINLLIANKNYKKLIKQCNLYKPRYISIKDSSLISKIKNKIDNNITIIEHDKINFFLNKNYSDMTILAISGYNALNYFDSILKNTKFLGLANKETIVSIGHLFKKINNKKTYIFPIDSEHFSLFYFFSKNSINMKNIKKIYLTASGGPFLNYDIKKLDKVTLSQAIKHPKWKMGVKNSIDSATLANKCLELIEAHYLFNIPFEKLEILIHPESLIHSIVEFHDGISFFNYFYNDMDIPIINFFIYSANFKKIHLPKKYSLKNNFLLNFSQPDHKKFPIYKTYKKMIDMPICKKIIFNVANENAVNLFKNNKIKFTDINKYVDKSLSLDINSSLSNVKKVIDFQRKIKTMLDIKNET